MTNLLQIINKHNTIKVSKTLQETKTAKRKLKKAESKIRTTESTWPFPNLQVNNISRVSKRIGGNAVQFVSR